MLNLCVRMYLRICVCNYECMYIHAYMFIPVFVFVQSSSSSVPRSSNELSPVSVGYGRDLGHHPPSEVEMTPNKILRVIVDNMQYRVDLEAIHQVRMYVHCIHMHIRMFVCT